MVCRAYTARLPSSIQLFLCVIFVLSSISFAANVALAFEEEYVALEDDSYPVQTSKISKAIFGAFRWKFGKNDSFMAPCTIEEDCDAGIRLICQGGRCICKQGDLFIEWPKYGCFSKADMFGQCEVSAQCVAMNPNTYCNPDGRCTCSQNYFYNGRECIQKFDMFGQCEVSAQCVAMNPNTYCNPDNGRCTCSPNYFYNGRECFLRYASFMDPCTIEEDCDSGIRLICQGGRCVCKQGDLFIEWPKYGCFSKVDMFDQCEVSAQCVAKNPNTYCNPDNGRCTCSPNCFYNGRECILRSARTPV